MRHCKAPGCDKSTAGRSHFCRAHKSHNRRHGDPEQRAITARDIKPHVRAFERLVDAQPREDKWAILERPLERLKAHCREQLEYARKYTHFVPAWRVRACQEILKVAGDVPAQCVISTVAAMAMLQHEQPHRFKSDRAYFVAVSRRFRGLTKLSAGFYWSEERQKLTAVYRDCPLKAAVFIGQLLATHFAQVSASAIQAKERAISREVRESAQIREMFAGDRSAQEIIPAAV